MTLTKTAALVTALAAVAFPALTLAPEAESVDDEIRRHLEHSRHGEESIEAEPILSSPAVREFYEERLFEPAWVSDVGPLPILDRLLAAIGGAAADGLEPADYHFATIGTLARPPVDAPGNATSSADLAHLDILATDAFLTLGAHLVSGRVDPRTFYPEWSSLRQEVDLRAALREALRSREPDAVLDSFRSRHPGYRRLAAALLRYRQIADDGGWEPLPPGEALRLGDVDPTVPILRRRLAATGDLPGDRIRSEDFDQPVEEGVIRFQRRHGLEPDGVVGRKTRAALDLPVASRIRQIELSLERWRWLPVDLGERYVVVNIPGFDLRAVRGTSTELEMKVAVGRSYRRTPVFSDLIRYLVVNPSWGVPRSLAVRDKLPEIKEDPSYLTRNGFRVFRIGGSDEEVDPATVDWAAVSPSDFPFRLRQRPGPKNALGRIKMMFPNEYNVYLHDTPDKSVFERSERDVSSGCIRLERALELGAWLLGGADGATIDQALASNRETIIPLPEPVPIHILYWTAWADDSGLVHFRPDINGRDPVLDAALVAATAVPPA